MNYFHPTVLRYINTNMKKKICCGKSLEAPCMFVFLWRKHKEIARIITYYSLLVAPPYISTD